MIPTFAEFTQGFSAVRALNKSTGRMSVVCWLAVRDDEAVARWVIKNSNQRLRKWDAIAKDAEVLEKYVYPHCKRIEVLDMVDKTVYTISVEDFRNESWLLSTSSGGEQWVVNREHWETRR